MGKMQESYAKGKRVFIGLEDSKRTWKLCARCDGVTIHETSMPAEYDGLVSYLGRSFPRCELHIAYEAGFGGFWLHDELQSDGIACSVLPPSKITQSKVCGVKNDKVDARRIAVVLEHSDCLPCHVPNKELREDRQVGRTLIAVQKEVIRMQCRIRQFFHFHHLNGLCGQQPWSAKNLQLLEGLPLDEPLRFCLDNYIEMLRCLLSCRKRIHSKLRELSKKQRYHNTFTCLNSAPGIGWLTAIRLVLEFGEDLSHFRSGRHFSSFLGLTGKERSTGDTVRRGHITRCGNSQVRSWLVESAWTAYKRDPVLSATFTNIYRRSRSKKIAIVAVARKLAVRLWTLAVTQQMYQPGLLQ